MTRDWKQGNVELNARGQDQPALQEMVVSTWHLAGVTGEQGTFAVGSVRVLLEVDGVSCWFGGSLGFSASALPHDQPSPSNHVALANTAPGNTNRRRT